MQHERKKTSQIRIETIQNHAKAGHPGKEYVQERVFRDVVMEGWIGRREAKHPALVDEDALRVLDDELHGQVLGVHIRHLPLEAVVAHDGRREDHR